MREAILRLLQESYGQHLSGEQISRELGITRAAVWKHIQALREEGFSIEAITRKGYLLRHTGNTLHAALIAPRLTTLALGRNLSFLRSAPSTNFIAKQLMEQGCAHGAMVLAEEQTAGRGRLGRAWANAPGLDICMSIVLRPRLEPQHAARFTLATALGVHSVATQLGLTPSIKWPNDVLLQGKKICGILLELYGNMDHIDGIVVGLGLNVNNNTFPEEIRRSATSLLQLLGHPVDRADVLCMLLNTLEPFYDACEGTQNFAELLGSYRRHCSTIGQQVSVTGVQGTLHGIAQDIDDMGRLLLCTEDATLHALAAGDVSLHKL